MNLCLDIKTIILNHMPDAQIWVSDPQNDSTHLEAIVVSDEFINMSVVSQHRKVMNLLKESFNTNLHALKLKTYTVEKWKAAQGE